MQRYFGIVKNNLAFLSEQDVFHLSRVMRAKLNDSIEVVSNNKVYNCKITSFTPLRIEVVNLINENHELKNKVTLICALLKGDKMDLVLQKATEIGVHEIILVQTERSIVKIKNDEKKAKLERFNKILKEASEQSKRTMVPTLDKIISFKDISEIKSTIKLIAYEEIAGSTTSFNDSLDKITDSDSVAIFIGPEGGFAKDEIDYSVKCGFKTISLGRRILRAETAAIYSLSVIANKLEND